MDPRCILLVDDEPSVRQSLERLLTGESYRVLAAANGLEARSLLDSARVDVAVLDVSLEEENGWDIAVDLQKRWPRLPIVMVSARPGLKSHPLASQMAAVMEKPLDLVEFLNTLANLTNAATPVSSPTISLTGVADHDVCAC